MDLRRLMVCSAVGLSALSVVAFAAGTHKSSIKSPLAATHHASYKPGNKPPATNPDAGKKKHFWDKK
jgi:hypothetical protein